MKERYYECSPLCEFFHGEHNCEEYSRSINETVKTILASKVLTAGFRYLAHIEVDVGEVARTVVKYLREHESD